MKGLLKKINRGVILSSVVILGIVGYYVFLSIKTAPARKEMESLATDFFGTYAQCAIVPTEYIKDKQTEEGIKPLVNSIREKFKPYFSDDEALDSFMEFYRSNQIDSQTIEQNNLINSLSINFKKMTSLKIDFNKNTASSTTVADYDSQQVYYDITWNDNGEIASKQQHPSNYKYDQRYSIGFVKVDGKWLISSFSYYSLY